MSRLPRLRSASPTQAENTPTLPSTTAYVNTRKRKSTVVDADDAGEDHDTIEEMIRPRKIAALGTAARPTRIRTVSGPTKPGAPLNTSKNAGNLKASRNSNSTSTSSNEGISKVPTLSSSKLGKPKPVAKPRVGAPATAARTTRGGGANTPPVAGPSRLASKPPPTTTTARARTVSTTTRPGLRSAAATKKVTPPAKPANRIATIQSQLAELEAARQADAERLAAEMELERTKVLELQNNHNNLSKELAEAKALELNHRRELVSFSDELDEMRLKHSKEIMELEMNLRKKEREAREVGEDLRVTRNELEREKGTVDHLRTTLAQQSQSQLTLTAENQALQNTVSSLQQRLDAANGEVEEMKRIVEEKEKLVVAMRKEVFESETVRRKLHNTILEMKGNIRVFCRVRPVLSSDLPTARIENLDEEEKERVKEEVKAKLAFPDNEEHKDIVLYSTSESAMGNERKEVYRFGFDRVFEPESTQAQVFEEISQLAQSCIDGYNVCIFAYGQTGSGKSFTMEGGPTDSTAGMIPRAVEQVFRVAEEMRSKGWEYKIEGQFLEIYNETIHDLLTPIEADGKKKHEIKHDPKTGRTTVTDATVVPLHSPSQVKTLLARAQSRRSVAATLMNERSSRSHSVFTLRISGVNVGTKAIEGHGADGTSAEVAGTGERCEGCLNLVDLAGSERLNVSFGPGVTEKERVKETQNINKSLSALGDVIAALGEKGVVAANGGGREVHIPYRNSKLTYLLQNSLSGNSKTLMVLNLSPLAAHVNESLTSLRFATKVNNTKIGTAKKTLAPTP